MALADQIQAAIERYCNTYFSSTAVVEYFDGGYDELITKKGPIISITSITDEDDSSSTVTASTYSFDANQGCIYKVDGTIWASSKARNRWKVTYQAGYASIPDDIQLAIDMWSDYLTSNASGTVKSYTTGDDSETYFDIKDIPPQVKTLIAPYKRYIYWH